MDYVLFLSCHFHKYEPCVLFGRALCTKNQIRLREINFRTMSTIWSMFFTNQFHLHYLEHLFYSTLKSTRIQLTFSKAPTGRRIASYKFPFRERETVSIGFAAIGVSKSPFPKIRLWGLLLTFSLFYV